MLRAFISDLNTFKTNWKFPVGTPETHLDIKLYLDFKI